MKSNTLLKTMQLTKKKKRMVHIGDWSTDSRRTEQGDKAGTGPWSPNSWVSLSKITLFSSLSRGLSSAGSLQGLLCFRWHLHSEKFDCTGKEEQVRCLRIFLLLPRVTHDSQTASEIHQLSPWQDPLPKGYRTKHNQGRKMKEIPTKS